MLQSKDPAFKLFGMKISLPTDCSQKKSKRSEDEPVKEEAETLYQGSKNLDASAETNLNSETSCTEKKCPKSKDRETEGKQDEANTRQEKSLKKPDKILPCPRCNSMDTKFCYYNNYNVNQPRHFCKACQRYWTAGGTMRNVPVGAGRRKSKNTSSHFRHIMISEALHATARIDLPNGTGHPAVKTNGRVLNFGLDAPICESMASILNLADNRALNGYHKHRGSADECSSGSSSSSEEGSKNLKELVNGFHVQMPCLHGVPRQYPWNSAVSSPAFCPSGYPMPFYPPAFWNGGVPNPLSLPWSSPTSLSNKKSPSSSPSSPLGKHSREGDIIKSDSSQEEDQFKHNTPNVCVVVPKTLRIDDPAEAAKSSIWATLGIKNESICSGGGMFKGFKSKSDGKNNVSGSFPLFQANPAAFSRSLKFQETA